MRRPAETTSKKRTHKETTECSTSEATNDGTCTPTAKWKCTNHCNIDLSDDEIGDMEKLEQTLQENHPNRTSHENYIPCQEEMDLGSLSTSIRDIK